MLPVALAIADEYAQCSDNLLEENGRCERDVTRFMKRIFSSDNDDRRATT
jgi:hypothetical protein